MDGIICRFVAAPVRTKGWTVLDANGDYNVYINNQISYNEQRTTFLHEINHIKHGHFFSSDDLKSIEACANKFTKGGL